MDEIYTVEWSKRVFDNFENSDISQKHFCFSDERGSDTNCWWEKPLVVALKHSEGIKHTVLFQETNSLQTQKLNNTRPLSFSLVFLSTLSTHNNISLACYLYTNSKQDNSTFKCEGGWRLWRQTTGGWRMAAGRLVAGRWQLVAAFLDLLDGLSLIQQNGVDRIKLHPSLSQRLAFSSNRTQFLVPHCL